MFVNSLNTDLSQIVGLAPIQGSEAGSLEQSGFGSLLSVFMNDGTQSVGDAKTMPRIKLVAAETVVASETDNPSVSAEDTGMSVPAQLVVMNEDGEQVSLPITVVVAGSTEIVAEGATGEQDCEIVLMVRFDGESISDQDAIRNVLTGQVMLTDAENVDTTLIPEHRGTVLTDEPARTVEPDGEELIAAEHRGNDNSPHVRNVATVGTELADGSKTGTFTKNDTISATSSGVVAEDANGIGYNPVINNPSRTTIEKQVNPDIHKENAGNGVTTVLNENTPTEMLTEVSGKSNQSVLRSQPTTNFTSTLNSAPQQTNNQPLVQLRTVSGTYPLTVDLSPSSSGENSTLALINTLVSSGASVEIVIGGEGQYSETAAGNMTPASGTVNQITSQTPEVIPVINTSPLMTDGENSTSSKTGENSGMEKTAAMNQRNIQTGSIGSIPENQLESDYVADGRITETGTMAHKTSDPQITNSRIIRHQGGPGTVSSSTSEVNTPLNTPSNPPGAVIDINDAVVPGNGPSADKGNGFTQEAVSTLSNTYVSGSKAEQTVVSSENIVLTDATPETVVSSVEKSAVPHPVRINRQVLPISIDYSSGTEFGSGSNAGETVASSETSLINTILYGGSNDSGLHAPEQSTGTVVSMTQRPDYALFETAGSGKVVTNESKPVQSVVSPQLPLAGENLEVPGIGYDTKPQHVADVVTDTKLNLEPVVEFSSAGQTQGVKNTVISESVISETRVGNVSIAGDTGGQSISDSGVNMANTGLTISEAHAAQSGENARFTIPVEETIRVNTLEFEQVHEVRTGTMQNATGSTTAQAVSKENSTVFSSEKTTTPNTTVSNDTLPNGVNVNEGSHDGMVKESTVTPEKGRQEMFITDKENGAVKITAVNNNSDPKPIESEVAGSQFTSEANVNRIQVSPDEKKSNSQKNSTGEVTSAQIDTDDPVTLNHHSEFSTGHDGSTGDFTHTGEPVQFEMLGANETFDMNFDQARSESETITPVTMNDSAGKTTFDIRQETRPLGTSVWDPEMTETEANVMNSIVSHARFMIGSGESSAEIRLDPPSLGKIKLKIVTENSIVTGKIIVESQEVRDIVQNSIVELSEQLEQSGLKVQSFDVQVGHNDGTDAWANRENQENLMQHLRHHRNLRNVQSIEDLSNNTGARHSKSMVSDYIDVWV
ncbi:flagellar hook-length control protein FliK [Candidatus Latescibacterota bacterium]